MSLILIGGIAGGALGFLCHQIDESMKIDDDAMQKNAKAADKIAEADRRLLISRRNLTDALTVNAKRKNGLLMYHFKMFLEQCEKMNKVVLLKKGEGIEELEKISEIQMKYNKYINLPEVTKNKILTDSQMLISFALRGLGGMMVEDSKRNLQIASKNMSQANAISAQTESICIAINAVTEHIKIVTELLEKLGMLYMQSIKHVTKILEKNGMCADRYSDNDIDSINLSFLMTKLLYRIINTPLIDDDGEIEKESLKVIEEGQKLLETIEGGVICE